MSDTSTVLVLKGFGGVPEITPEAIQLRDAALAQSKPVLRVDNDQEQAVAVAALHALKAIRLGLEATRKAIKAPVIDLGKKIDEKASTFGQTIHGEETRLQGLVNHYQLKILDQQRAEAFRLDRERREQERLAAEAQRLKEEAERTQNAETQAAAVALETKATEKALDLEMSGAPIVPLKPKGLVVQSRLNFQITDAIVFCQAYPQFFSWNPETETLKLKRRELLEELNREDGKGIFHMTHYPEELPDQQGSQLVKPPGARVYPETRSHVR